MSKVGIIPAAGKAERWGGVIKELLPTGHDERLIDTAIMAMAFGGADRIIVVTSSEKIGPLAQYLDHRYDQLPIHYILQRGDNDIWSAIETSFDLAGDLNLFAMPDTIIPLASFLQPVNEFDFTFGTFKTRQPERFGVFHEGEIVNKDPGLPAGTYDAWGVLAWSKRVVEFWQRKIWSDYTTGLNSAYQYFPAHIFGLDFYFDMASWADYQAFVASIGTEGMLQRQIK
jgi:hypothetical protein